MTTVKTVDFQWPQGFYNDGIQLGLGSADKLDFGYLVSEVPAAAAGTYTTNQFQAAPTKLTKQTINQAHQIQAVVMNSAIANSCTGKQGELDALKEQQLLADKLQIDAQLVGVASTGLIGAPLPMDKITAGISQLTPHSDDAVTRAVMTTDLHPKQASVQIDLDGQTATITGFAKGSGMIHPKMATMLGFVTTDAAVNGETLQALLSEDVDTTFNQITVDGDTSTNDMVVVMANGLAGNTEIASESTLGYETFKEGLHAVLTSLAQQIAADGEGATKLVECNVTGAHSTLEGQQVAKAIVGSNLVKAAIFGQDPNWGRIISTIGATDAHVDIDHVAIKVNDIAMVTDSLAVPFDEQQAHDSMGADKVIIDVDLHAGDQTGQAWGCDLTYNYVKINASYHT